jgi:hypothetical protein
VTVKRAAIVFIREDIPNANDPGGQPLDAGTSVEILNALWLDGKFWTKIRFGEFNGLPRQGWAIIEFDPVLVVVGSSVKVRRGPGVRYGELSPGLGKNQRVRITGYADVQDGIWYFIDRSESRAPDGWVAGFVKNIIVFGDTSRLLPRRFAPLPPAATPTPEETPTPTG